MSTIVRIPTPLRSFTDGADEVTVAGVTVGEVLSNLGSAHVGLLDRVLDESGEVRHFVNVFLGEQNVLQLRGLSTPVADGDVLSIIPAVAGGGPQRIERRGQRTRQARESAS
jgi:molybdopterin converting factor small subunit